MIPAAIAQWASAAPPGTRRYRVYLTGRTVLYCSTFDGLGQQFVCYESSTAACRAIDAGDISWRLDLRAERVRRERAAVAQ